MDHRGPEQIGASIDALSNALGNIGPSIGQQDEQRLNELVAQIPFDDGLVNVGHAITMPGIANYGRVTIGDPFYVEQADQFTKLREQIIQVDWQPPPHVADVLGLEPWRTSVRPETSQVYSSWRRTHDVPDAFFDGVPGQDVVNLVDGETREVVELAAYNPAWALGKFDDLIDFLSTTWKELRRRVSNLSLGMIIVRIRDALSALSGKVNASGGFSLEISTTGLAYQLHFDVGIGTTP